MNSIVFLGLALPAWITIVVTLGVFLTLLFTKFRAEYVFFTAMAVLTITGVLSMEDSFAGLDSTSVLLVGVLYIVIAGLKYTGALDWIVQHLMGTPKSRIGALLRLMIPVGLMSSCMSNTSTTALFKGVVERWATKLNISPSKLLIPLAYAATMGGLLTLIGTPPNLIIANMYAQQDPTHAFNLLAPLPIGLACMVVNILVCVLLGRLLPDRVAPGAGSDQADDVLLDENGQPAIRSKSPWKTFLAMGIMVAMLVASSTNLLPLTTSTLIAALLMVATRCCTGEQAFKEIDWSVIIIFAGSLCIGKAITVSGLDELIVKNLLGICGTNPYVVLTVICLVGALCTEFLSDTGCAAMFFPIAWQAATQLGVNPAPFMLALMMSVSSSFATPIATPPNMIVYYDGGYRFSDYARIGVPMKIAHLATAILMTTLIYPF